MSRMRVTIDQLNLKGLDAGSEKALAQALKTELARVLSDPVARAASAARSQRTPVMKLGSMPLEPGAAGGRRFGPCWRANIVKKVKP